MRLSLSSEPAEPFLSRDRLPFDLLLMLTAPLTRGLGGRLSMYLPPGRQGRVVLDKAFLDFVNYSLREEILTPEKGVDKAFRFMLNRGPAQDLLAAMLLLNKHPKMYLCKHHKPIVQRSAIGI